MFNRTNKQLRHWRYGQTALVCALEHDRPHDGAAHQYFLPSGPFAILPLTFAEAADYEAVEAGDELVIEGVTEAIAAGETVSVQNRTRGQTFSCRVTLAPRQRKILAAGGLLNYTRTGGR